MPEFLQPTSLEQATDLLQQKQDVRFLAGGTDLIPLMRGRAATCRYLMDVKRIPELHTFSYTPEGLTIGAAITCNQILHADFLKEEHRLLQEAAGTLANSLLRNRATLMGNICNASPGGDMLPACLVLGAAVHTRSPRGERVIPLNAFFTGVKTHVLAPDELAVKLTLPNKAGSGMYLKKRRIRGHDLAQVGLAGFYGEDHTLTFAAAAVGPTPILIGDIGVIPPEALPAAKEEIKAKVRERARPISDVRSSKEYRLAMLDYFVGRAVDAFATGEQTEVRA
ncbi:MAG TPA: xanthine dehydrogenase family protein subunit M [Feifaniaceae bacterium]|nr:xanthine dehydrogenase family protein subunit M [Feifaniaceae bacterium]